MNTSVATPAEAGTPANICLPMLVLGQFFPEHGGTYVGRCRSTDGKSQWEVFAAPVETGECQEITFGPRGVRVDGADDHRDGLANTLALINAAADHPAARACNGLAINGRSDYYLPSRAEMMLCWMNAPESFSRDDVYWTSTQYVSDYAWSQYFYDGNQYFNVKDWEQRCRAVRRELINSSL